MICKLFAVHHFLMAATTPNGGGARDGTRGKHGSKFTIRIFSVFDRYSIRGPLPSVCTPAAGLTIYVPRGWKWTVRSPVFRRFFTWIPARAGTTNIGHFFPRAV